MSKYNQVASLCGVCNKNIRESQACCDSCDILSHRTCVGLTLHKYKRLGKSCENWFCYHYSLWPQLDSFFEGTPPGQSEPGVTDPSQGASAEHQVTEGNYECLRSKGLNITHLNARSLLDKLDEICINTNLAVIGITESWLDNTVSDSEVEFHGYQSVRRDRDRRGGGVCVYVRSDFAFNVRTDSSFGLETVRIELLLSKTRPIQVEDLPDNVISLKYLDSPASTQTFCLRLNVLYLEILMLTIILRTKLFYLSL